MLLISKLLLASLIQKHKAALLVASELERVAGLYQFVLAVVEHSGKDYNRYFARF